MSQFQQNLILTHELGHALGLGHTDQCGFTSELLMHTGPDVLSKPDDTPMPYDKANVAELYGFTLR